MKAHKEIPVLKGKIPTSTSPFPKDKKEPQIPGIRFSGGEKGMLSSYDPATPGHPNKSKTQTGKTEDLGRDSPGEGDDPKWPTNPWGRGARRFLL